MSNKEMPSPEEMTKITKSQKQTQKELHEGGAHFKLNKEGDPFLEVTGEQQTEAEKEMKQDLYYTEIKRKRNFLEQLKKEETGDDESAEKILEKNKLSGEVLKNPEFLLNVLSESYKPSFLEYADPDGTTFRGNERFMREAIECSSGTFEFASEILKQNEDFVLHAIENGVHLEDVPESLRENENFLLKALSASSSAIYEIPERLRADKDFILKAKERIGTVAVETIEGGLRDDKEFLLEHFGNTQETLRVASDRLRDDEEFVYQILRRFNEWSGRKISDPSGMEKDGVGFASRRLREDPEFIQKLKDLEKTSSQKKKAEIA